MSKIIEEQNRKYLVLHTITGAAMAVHREYKPGLLESAYEAALKYLLEQEGIKVEQQVYLPIYWKDVQLDQSYRLDLVVNENMQTNVKGIFACGNLTGGLLQVSKAVYEGAVAGIQATNFVKAQKRI